MNTKNAQTTTLRVVILGLAIIAAYWLLSTVETIPAQACQINGIDNTGHNYTTNECGR